MSTTPLEAARAAHAAVTAAQQTMRDSAATRDVAVREAHAAGVGATTIARALGVSRNRVYQMIGKS